MALSHELISQFAKIVKNDKKQSAEATIYGTVVTDGNGNKYVKLDGSDQLTPLTDDERPILDSTTANANDGERVSVLIKNHTATVTGNISSPSVRSDDFKDLDDQVTDIKKFDIAIGERVQANEGYIKQLQTDKANVGDLTAATARITELETKKASIEELNAAKAEITDLKTTKIDTEVANATYATIKNLNATNANLENLSSTYGKFQELTTNKFTAIDANITKLDTEKLSTTTADAKYANIDFSNIGTAAIEKLFTDSGIIGDLIMSEGHVTGKLVGVTIIGDLIEGGTVKADKLVVLGEDGLYYKLNTNGVSTTAEQTEYNSLNGSVITANTITAEKINVDDLVAFDATIGGFNITNSSIYSGAKSSIDNTTRGIYLDNDGQIAFGDSQNYLRYFKDSDNKYKLQISAASIIMSTTNKNIEDEINSIQDNQKIIISDISELKVSKESITASVSEITENQNSLSGNIAEIRDNIAAQNKVNSDQFDSLTKKVESSMTADQVQLAISTEIAKGIDKVTTSTGFTFNEAGLTISKTDSEISTNIDEDGMSIMKGSEEVLTADNTGVQARNLHANTYLIIGTNSRFEDYGSDRTGCFWIGN